MTDNTKDQLIAITAAFPAFWSAQAFAAEPSEPGLPQLDIATWPSQLFWLAIIFGAGYLVMAKVVTPQIGAVLEKRRKTLDSDLEKARTASSDASKVRADYESNLEKARNDASDFAKHAAAEASKIAVEADAKFAQKLARKFAKAEAKLSEAKSSALSNLNEVAAEAAVDAVVALAGIKTTSSQAAKVAKSIAAK